ncbi:MAG: hydantoinase B/oxoprolinase family protein [Myxococcota bacterium]|nr:hydantoinase B/oxoprolinase family protein [Myxococcota bacterium]
MSRVWMDQGGTFTDVVRVAASGEVTIEKVPTDRATLHALAEDAVDVRRGTTAATNALLERTGSPTLLITNQGFGDAIRFGDGRRPDLFALAIQRPAPLAAAVVEVGGRIDATGAEVHPVTVEPSTLRAHWDRGIRSVAIVLIHGPLRPEHERRIADLCTAIGFTTVRMGHAIAPSRGFLQRLQTTVADAALSPLLPRAPGLYMRSDGGLSHHDEWTGSQAILSGPAGGVMATARLAAAAGLGPAFGLDMGGTSTDVCRVDGAPERSDRLRIDGLELRVPTIELHTVAAGGGSILAQRDGLLTVGPQSAGSNPGPAAYGRGGPATLTDAEVILGRLPDFPSVCGPDRRQELDRAAARRAIMNAAPGLEPEPAAEGFKRVAAETAARAVRALAAARGVDPADHALVAFGGAGPGHATTIARALGIRTVVVPRLAGVFSAVGIGHAPRRAETVAPIRGSIDDALKRAQAALPFAGHTTTRLAIRHRGTQHPIEIPVRSDRVGAGLTEDERHRFHRAHRDRFGFERTSIPIEAVEVRAAVEQPAPSPNLHLPDPEPVARTTRAWFDGWREVPVVPIHRAHDTEGPALLVGDGTTVVVDPGWRVTATAGWVQLDDKRPAPRRSSTAFDPIQTAVFAARIMAIAEEMGEHLARLARSVSIRERRDFSAAVFDCDGHLIANAPHVPVHLGAMGETVRGLLRDRGDDLQPGTAWASNDPYCGGSHLPDITVIRPVHAGATRVAFVAVRGHHVDVGGSTPGSMPPASTHIEHEGLRFRNIPLAGPDGFTPPCLDGTRSPHELRADLLAQVAAVQRGDDGLQGLIEGMGVDGFTAQMRHALDAAERATARLLTGMPGVHTATEVLDDGTPIAVTMTVADGRATIAIDAPPHPGNLNAPSAVARAGVLYVLRCLIDEPLPLLNEGSLRRVQIETTPGGMFDPQYPTAVAGGNVECSQRLVDALLRAVGAQAASQGTMNNLTVGMEAGIWYETIAGGSGAGPGFSGTDAVQVHMTNTRASDVEEMEARFPVRLENWRIRPNSGGSGTWSGGDGLEKTWRFLAPATVSILAQRRAAGAPGAVGGRPGLPGVDQVDRGAGWEPASSQFTVTTGDRLRMQTPGGGGFGDASEEDYDWG